MGPTSRRFATIAFLFGGAIFLATACEEDRRRKSSDDDDATTGTGGSTTSGPGSGGGTFVPGGPEITSVIASPATLHEGDSTTITAMAVDDDGLEDIVGGVLTDATGQHVIGTFTQVSGGTFTVSTSWWALHEIEPLNFVDQVSRTVVARFTDTTQKVGARSVELGLICEGSVNQGFCEPCDSCAAVLEGDGFALCGLNENTSACSPGSDCDHFDKLWTCACSSPAYCVDSCGVDDLCEGYVPISSICEGCLVEYCTNEYTTCD